jgi:hypothetical protein
MAKLNAYQKQMLGNAGPVDIENFHLAETYRLAKRIILGKLPCAYGFVNGKFLKIGNLPWDLEVTKKNNPTTRPEVPEELWKMNDDKRRISNFLLQKQDEYLAAEHPFEMLLVNMKEELYDNFRAVDDGEALAPLDSTGSVCKACGGFRRHRFDEYHVWSSLNALPHKLNNAAGELYHLAKGEEEQ